MKVDVAGTSEGIRLAAAWPISYRIALLYFLSIFAGVNRMARLYLLDLASQPLIISTDRAVGHGCPNVPVDVKLVQFFIHVTARHGAQSWGWFIDRKFPNPTIDGICGPKTLDWIRRFQDALKERKKNIIANGKIDAITNGTSETSVGGPYMIYMLNVAYYGAFGEGAISRIADHPLFPRDVARTITLHGRNW